MGTDKSYIYRVVGILYESKNILVECEKAKSREDGEDENKIVIKVVLIVHEDGTMEMKPESELQ